MEQDNSKCERCKENFDDYKNGRVLLDCGDILCEPCIEFLSHNNHNICPLCKKEVNFRNLNMKTIVKENKNVSISASLSSQAAEEPAAKHGVETENCEEHKTRHIDYFCQQCNRAICVDCIYHTHNGHHLSRLDDNGCNLTSRNNKRKFGRFQQTYRSYKEKK